MSRAERLKTWLKVKWARARGRVPYKVVGYWNGVCPRCGEHIGIDIKRNLLTTMLTARCAACGAEIYDLIKEPEEDTP